MPRRFAPLTAAQEQALAEVERASERRDAAERAVVAAIVDAAALGLTPTRIAPATGTTRQAVEGLLRRHRG